MFATPAMNRWIEQHNSTGHEKLLCGCPRGLAPHPLQVFCSHIAAYDWDIHIFDNTHEVESAQYGTDGRLNSQNRKWVFHKCVKYLWIVSWWCKWWQWKLVFFKYSIIIDHEIESIYDVIVDDIRAKPATLVLLQWCHLKLETVWWEKI